MVQSELVNNDNLSIIEQQLINLNFFRVAKMQKLMIFAFLKQFNDSDQKQIYEHIQSFYNQNAKYCEFKYRYFARGGKILDCIILEDQYQNFLCSYNAKQDSYQIPMIAINKDSLELIMTIGIAQVKIDHDYHDLLLEAFIKDKSWRINLTKTTIETVDLF